MMKKPKYKKTGDSKYDVYVGKKKLCSVVKLESARRSYWFIDEVFRGSNRLIKFKSNPKDHGPVKNWEDTRKSLIYATFPLELGITYDVNLEKYSL